MKKNEKCFLDSSFSSKLQHLTLSPHFIFDLEDEHIKQFLNLNLTSISIENCDLSKVNDYFLAKLVNSCKECVIIEYDCDSDNDPNIIRDDDYYLGNKKLAAIVREMQDDRSKLKSFKLSFLAKYNGHCLDLSSIPTRNLAKAFSKLHELHLDCVKMDSEQLNLIFEFGLASLTRLRFREIPFDVAQMKQLLETLDKTSKLKSLELSKVDVREIPSDFLARVINKIKRVVLTDIKIEALQIDNIFLAIIAGDLVLKHFDLALEYGDNCLSEVDAKVLANAVNKLEHFGFNRKLSVEQTKMIFKVMSLKTNLKSLLFDYTFGEVGNVDPERCSSLIFSKMSEKEVASSINFKGISFCDIF
jgi:hypothetical protein